MDKVIVIGGGAGGCGTALALANKDFKVVLIEELAELLRGSSNQTPGRMGLGFHYIHPETGFMYMKQSIAIIKKFSGCRLAEEKDEKHPLRNGRYFIVKDSLFSKEEILKTYSYYKQKYAELVQEDSTNAVFGAPEDFFRILDPEEYKNDVNMDLISVGIETREHLLNWPNFREFYIDKLTKHPNIKVLADTKVENVTKGKDCRFAITTKDMSGSITQFESNYVVNATWNKMEKVRQGLDDINSTAVMRNRLKILLEVDLPDNLQNTNSMFFCMGPHCMFSNLGDGRGLMSYAPVTNVCDWQAGLDFPSEQVKRLLAQKPTVDEVEEYGQGIKDGVSKYIPKMQQAKIRGIRCGVVRIAGENANIFAHDSDIHKRDEFGVEELIPGWVENNCMKLMFFDINGEITCEKIVARVKQDCSMTTTKVLQSLSSVIPLNSGTKEENCDDCQVQIVVMNESKNTGLDLFDKNRRDADKAVNEVLGTDDSSSYFTVNLPC